MIQQSLIHNRIILSHILSQIPRLIPSSMSELRHQSTLINLTSPATTKKWQLTSPPHLTTTPTFSQTPSSLKTGFNCAFVPLAVFFFSIIFLSCSSTSLSLPSIKRASCAASAMNWSWSGSRRIISFVRPCRSVMKGLDQAFSPLNVNLSLPGLKGC